MESVIGLVGLAIIAIGFAMMLKGGRRSQHATASNVTPSKAQKRSFVAGVGYVLLWIPSVLFRALARRKHRQQIDHHIGQVGKGGGGKAHDATDRGSKKI